MIPKSLELIDFIRKNAKKAVIQRAQAYLPTLEKQQEHQIEFSCRGSSDKTYRQHIEFAENKINTFCDCPYEGEGLCKHLVAALQYLIGHQTSYAEKNHHNQNMAFIYPLSDGIIDFTAIKQDFSKHGVHYGYGHYEIKKFEDNRLILASHYGETTTIERVSDGIKLSCTCRHKRQKHYCEHLLTSINTIEKHLGANIFQPEYRSTMIAKAIADYGLTLNDDYEQIVDIEFSWQGVRAIPHIPDLMPISVMNKINSFTSLQSQNEITHGIGVVLEFDRGFDRITCIIGKLNKQGEIATSIKEIPSYSAAEIIYADFMPKNAADLYYLVNNLAKTLDGFEQHITISRLENIIQLSKKLAEQLGDVPIFYHDARHSFAKKHLIPLKFSDQSATLSYKMNENEQVYRLNAHYQIDSRHYITHSDLLNITPFGVIRQAEIFLFPDGQTALNSWQMMLYPSLAFLKKDIQVFENQVLSPLSQRYEIQSKSFDMQKKVQTQELAFRQQVYVSEQHGEVIFRLAAQYPEKLIQLPSQQLRLHFDEKTKKFQQKPRNNAAENAFIHEFEQLHPDFQLSDGIYALQPSQLIENFWFIDFAEKLKQHDIELFGTQHLSSFQYNLNKPNLSIRVESGIDWFDVHIDIAYGEQKVSLKDIQKAFLKKQHFIELADGTIGMLPEEWINRFAQYFKAGEIKKDSLRISNFQFAIIDELYDHLEQKPAFLQDLYARKQRLQNLHWQENIIASDGINATLRPYQQHGLNWLAFLHENRLGGCLADDMGLGKTLQAIAFIQYLKTTFQPNLPNLIIAPTSLIFNWQAEIAKFCPSLKVLTFTGQGREKYLEHFTEYDVILTTYGSLIQDIDILQEQAFYYIVLDESQAIKNPQSQRYKAVRLLKAYNRLILSGTPIENNTFDLYAQFNFLNPGLLGNNAHFKKTFADEIDKNKDTDSANLLAKMVNPFILRRTKQQVATELPEKTEIIMYCEMDSAQRQVYNAVKQEYRDYLFSKINSDGINQSQMYILEGLTKLRQICNSPALIEDADYGNESVKLAMLIDNIKEKTGKHKILVFSSFVKMLALIECRLKQENISYEYLDGQTRNRQQKVDNFQNQADIRVFLISTKAGGTGLNLTEADYVFIVDPWWNPAVENQAIDRCYRIGQTKQVMAYRMICRDTIEEKILALQQKKQGIAESIISIDTEKKSFDLDEVKALFA